MLLRFARGQEKNWRVMRKGIKDDLGVNFFPRLPHSSRWSAFLEDWIPEQLLSVSSSNIWGHRSSLHKLNARNQWVPLCLHVRFSYARFMPLHVLGTESWEK